MMTRKTKTQGTSKNLKSDVSQVIPDSKNEETSEETDSKPSAKQDHEPILVVFFDRSSVIYYDGTEAAKKEFTNGIKKICTGAPQELKSLKIFSDEMEEAIDGLSIAEQYIAKTGNYTPALVRFKDGSAFPHFLGKEYIVKKLENSSFRPEDLEFEEGTDFKQLEQISRGYNMSASARVKNENDVMSVKAGLAYFKKLRPTSTERYATPTKYTYYNKTNSQNIQYS